MPIRKPIHESLSVALGKPCEPLTSRSATLHYEDHIKFPNSLKVNIHEPPTTPSIV